MLCIENWVATCAGFEIGPWEILSLACTGADTVGPWSCREHTQYLASNKFPKIFVPLDQIFDIYLIFDIFVNCKWVATRWQLYNTHLHTNSTQNDTKQTIHRTTQDWEYKNFGIVRAVPRLGELYPGIGLTTEEKARKNLSQGSRTIRIRKPNNKIT